MVSKDLKRALFATLFFGAASGIFVATLNNYLAEIHSLSAEARGWLELPRELPGFLIMFVAGALRFLAAPSDGSDVNGTVFGLVVAAAGLVWLIVARIRIWQDATGDTMPLPAV